MAGMEGAEAGGWPRVTTTSHRTMPRPQPRPLLVPAFAIILCAISTPTATAEAPPPAAEAPPPAKRPGPNFVLIMADDLGVGDPGCYGNHTLR